MKQVMCINDENKWWSHTTLLQVSGPAYMEICDVLEEVQEGDQYGYILSGYGSEPYYSGLFIPLSNPTLEIEEEMEAEVTK